MRIGINALSLEPGYCGETVYLRKVFARVRDLQPETTGIFITSAQNNEFFAGCDRVVFEQPVDASVIGLPASEREFTKTIESAGIDVLFSSLRTAPVKPRVPQVLYTMDLQFILEPLAKGRWRDKAMVKRVVQTCENAVAIVAPSEFIRRQLLELLEVPLDRVVVAPLGVSDVFAEPQACWVQQPYFLSVGATRASKNVEGLLRAFQFFESRGPHSLVIAGLPGDREFRDWGPRVMRIQQCPENALAALYQHCEAVVCSSFYEGSGVMVLEAMRAGAQLVAGRVGAIPEFAGNAPIYCNPQNAGMIASAIQRAMDIEPEKRKRRALYMTNAAAEYTWDNCAWKTLQAFRTW
ncbi:MAG TPA: glycosyltransferase family 1 protein [Candidatus Hydrogenedentes bacterium]|nr:glycosyltransferase family 1 protein [Candidatus Hydrogenedentota bacterium]